MSNNDVQDFIRLVYTVAGKTEKNYRFIYHNRPIGAHSPTLKGIYHLRLICPFI